MARPLALSPWGEGAKRLRGGSLQPRLAQPVAELAQRQPQALGGARLVALVPVQRRLQRVAAVRVGAALRAANFTCSMGQQCVWGVLAWLSQQPPAYVTASWSGSYSKESADEYHTDLVQAQRSFAVSVE